MKRLSLIAIMVTLIFASQAISPKDGHAFLFHATRKALAERIMARGFSKARMKASARFGKGIYAAERRAIAEKEAAAGAKATIRLREGKYLAKNTIDIRKPSAPQIKKIIGAKKDLRGSVKNGVIGPKTGHDIGKVAGRSGKVVRYKSARANGSNIFIPKKTLERHPKIVKPEKIMPVGR